MSDLLLKTKGWLDKFNTNHFSYIRRGIKPKRDWILILVLTVASLFIVTLFSYYFYQEVSAGKIFNVERDDSQKEVKINNTLLGKVIDDINSREQLSIKIRNGSIGKPDPSL